MRLGLKWFMECARNRTNSRNYHIRTCVKFEYRNIVCHNFVLLWKPWRERAWVMIAHSGKQTKLVKQATQYLYAGTPNGWKISILLKELDYPHEIKSISLAKSEQKEPSFLAINPNGRIPAIGAGFQLSEHL